MKIVPAKESADKGKRVAILCLRLKPTRQRWFSKPNDQCITDGCGKWFTLDAPVFTRKILCHVGFKNKGKKFWDFLVCLFFLFFFFKLLAGLLFVVYKMSDIYSNLNKNYFYTKVDAGVSLNVVFLSQIVSITYGKRNNTIVCTV